MAAIRGTIRDGKVEFDAPPGWPDGTEVAVTAPADTGPVRMAIEDEQGDDPESIARWLAWFDSLEPLVVSPEDEERIRKARADQKAFELSKWDEHSAKLEKLFE